MTFIKGVSSMIDIAIVTVGARRTRSFVPHRARRAYH